MANEVIIPVKYVVDGSDLDKAGAKVGALTAEEKKLEAEMNDVSAAARKQTTEFHKAGDAGVKAAKDTEKQYNMMGNSLKNIGSLIAAAFAIDQIINYGKEIINVTAQFQKMQAVLATALGSESAAQQAFARIQQFASETPYSVAQVTESFVKLVARGFTPTNNELRKLGDLAASTGKDFDQLVEAILDAQTGEFERLKEFGVRARAAGDNVAFTFKGITTEVQKTDDAIKNYVLSLGELEGVSGSMASISDTLGGKISNFGDALDNLFYTIGQGTDGPLSGFISGMTSAVNVLSRFLEGDQAEQLRRVAETLQSTGFDPSQVKTIADAKEEIAKLTAENEKLSAAFKENLSGAPEQEGFFDTLIAKAKLIAQGLPFATIATADFTDKNKEARVEYEANAAKIQQLNDRIKELGKTQDTVSKGDKYKANTRVKYSEELDFIGKLTDETDKSGKDRYNKESTYIDRRMRLKTQEAAEEKAIREQSDKDFYDSLDEREAYERRLVAQTIDFAIFATSAYAEFSGMKSQERIENLQIESEREQQMAGDNALAKQQIEAQYNKQIQAERAKQAQIEKNMALFQIAVDTGAAIIKTGAELGYPAAIPFQVMAGIQGAIQAALVQSRQIPRFAKGTRSVMGGTPGEDSVLAMLMPGERVVTTEKNRQLSPALDVLTDSKRSPQFWNKTLLEIEKLGILTPPKLSDLPPIIGGNADLLAALSEQSRILKTLPIHQAFIDEKGFTKKVIRNGSSITDLNKRYGPFIV